MNMKSVTLYILKSEIELLVFELYKIDAFTAAVFNKSFKAH